jgi:hypothetical protein
MDWGGLGMGSEFKQSRVGLGENTCINTGVESTRPLEYLERGRGSSQVRPQHQRLSRRGESSLQVAPRAALCLLAACCPLLAARCSPALQPQTTTTTRGVHTPRCYPLSAVSSVNPSLSSPSCYPDPRTPLTLLPSPPTHPSQLLITSACEPRF